MSTCYWPVRRLRRKTCVPVDAAVLAQQLPRGSRTLSGVAARIPCRDDNVFCSFSGTDVIATVASFLNVRALGRCLRLEKRVCGDESLWRILLRQVSHSAFALSVSSARASVWNMMCRPCGVWPADARNSYVQLRNYRWCLDFCCDSSRATSGRGAERHPLGAPGWLYWPPLRQFIASASPASVCPFAPRCRVERGCRPGEWGPRQDDMLFVALQPSLARGSCESLS